MDSIVSGGVRLEFGGGHNVRLSRARGTSSLAAPPVVSKDFVVIPALALPGRAQQVQSLTQTVARWGRVGIHAASGYGKTALLRHVAGLLASGQPPGSVVYLRAGGSHLDDLRQRLFRAIYRPPKPVRLTRQDPTALLSRARSVVVLDDLTLDPDSLSLLQDAIPGCVLIAASDHELTGLRGRSIGLPGLDWEAGLDVVHQWLGRPPDWATAASLHERVDGQPLALRLAARTDRT